MSDVVKLCYRARIGDCLFDVAIGYVDSFISLYQGEKIIFESDVLVYHSFKNDLLWYERTKTQSL